MTPDIGYYIKSVKYNDTEIEPVDGAYSFAVPDSNVTVTAKFAQIPYSLSTNNNELGTISAKIDGNDTTTAHYDDTVTLDISPADDYLKNAQA
ncbi:MAG: hypothetical protein K6C68_02450 [Ruminococcus sp.]|nr:hypothetical protein [Ruminococcus sp.]